MKVLSHMDARSGRIAITRFAIKMFLLVTIVAISSSLRAQSFYGSVSGTVTDATGALIPDATVSVTNVGTNETQTARTGREGQFNFVNLVPSTYTVKVEKPGFKQFVAQELHVEVGAVARVDAHLQVGA